MPSTTIISARRVVCRPRSVLRLSPPVSSPSPNSALSSELLPTADCPARQVTLPRMASRSCETPVPSRALTLNTRSCVPTYSRRICSASSSPKSILLTQIAGIMPPFAARRISLSHNSMSGCGTLATTSISISTLATLGRSIMLLRGRISSSQPSSPPCPGVKRTRSPTIGVIF